MSMMISEVYDALRSADADEEKARAAAVALAASEKRVEEQFIELRKGIEALRLVLRTELSRMRGDLNLIRWILGLVLATNIAIVLRLFLT